MIAKARVTLAASRPNLLARPHLDAYISTPVVILAAGAGFGKSELLSRWASLSAPARTAYGLCSRLGETAASLLELLFASVGISDLFRVDQPWQQQTDLFLESLFEQGELIVMLDDLHHIESSTSDATECRLLLSYLLDYRPPTCRLVLSGRTLPELADLDVRQMRGELVVVRGQDLALNQAQLEELAPGRGQQLEQLTSGWPLAAAVLMRCPPESWEDQRETLGSSLLRMATRELKPVAAEAVAVLGLMGWASQQEIQDPEIWQELVRLSVEGVLVRPLDKERLQVHPLFAEQYQEEAGERARQLAANGLLASGRIWEALELTRGPEELRDRLLEHGSSLLAEGRHHLLSQLLERAAEHSILWRWRGEVNWRLGDPAGAMEAFARSAHLARESGHGLRESRAWAAAAGLYLDAVSPAQAILYLRRAYRALGPGDAHEKAGLLERFAENAVNQGKARAAARYRRLAARWDSGRQEDLVVTARILLRSGRLAEARGGLEVALGRGQSAHQSEGVLEGHRDPRLVLSYIHALEGRADKAEALAREALAHARELEDRLTEAVALTRLGHARLIREKSGESGTEGSLELYAQADTLIRAHGVDRLRAEMLMGQALCYSHRGNTPRAYEAAREGVTVAQQGGDLWMRGWLELVQASAAVEGGHPGAAGLLESTRESFRACRDRFGYAVTELWLAGVRGEASFQMNKALEEFPFLAERPTLFGPSPEGLPLAAIPSAAGQRLQVFCLGPLSLLRDGEAIPAKAFKRKKARELLAILLSAPDSFFHREELAAWLWPEADQKASLRDFRVALHALSDTLEPERAKNTTAFCIDRQDERYRILSDQVDLDTARFEALLEKDEVEEWERALKLYRGPFCEDYPYLDSLTARREKYERQFMQLAEGLTQCYLESGEYGKAVELAQRMLAKDPTWEPAYRFLMRGQAASGHEHLLPRTFTLCLETLEEELGVEPSEETFELARELLGDQLATIL